MAFKILDSIEIRKRVNELHRKSIDSKMLLMSLQPCKDRCFTDDEIKKIDTIRMNFRKSILKGETDITTFCYMLGFLLEKAGVREQFADYVLKMAWIGTIYHEGELEENLYYKNIKLPEVSLGDFALSYDIHEKYEPLFYNCGVDSEKLIVPQIAVTDCKIKFPCIKRNGQTWMSVTPNEIITMRDAVNEAKGNILTFGLGMGYYTYMVSEKPDVKSVTVIENSPEIIQLFEDYILPKFKHKDKVHIVKADAFDYIDYLEDGVFDYCFVDIWDDILDIDEYVRMKKACSKFKQMQCDFRIEDTFLFEARDRIIAKAVMALNTDLPTRGFTEIGRILDNIEISKIEDLEYWMYLGNISSLISES